MEKGRFAEEGPKEGWEPLCRVAARLAHQLNGVFTVIGGHAELALLEGADAAPAVRQSLEQVIEAGRRGRELVRALQARCRQETPAQSEPEQSASGACPAPAAAVPSRKMRVLVVDDETGVSRTTARLLETLGCAARVAAEAGEAFRILETCGESFDLALIDYRMPGIAGEELARGLRARAPGTALVVVSGACESLDRERLRALGVQAFLPKPFRAAELASLLQSL